MPVESPVLPAEDKPKQPPVCICHHKYASPCTYETLPTGNLVDRGRVVFYRCQITQLKTQTVLAPVRP